MKDASITPNTRVGYPIHYIPNAELSGVGGIPKVVIFLTADSFGVLPPISRLSQEAANVSLCNWIYCKTSWNRIRC